jgi:hypothetical protein
VKKILWWRILLAGIAAELLYIVYLVAMLGDIQRAYSVAGFAGVFGLMLIGGLWIGRSAGSKSTPQGGLVGVAGILFYTALGLTSALIGPEKLGIESQPAESMPVGLFRRRSPDEDRRRIARRIFRRRVPPRQAG